MRPLRLGTRGLAKRLRRCLRRLPRGTTTLSAYLAPCTTWEALVTSVRESTRHNLSDGSLLSEHLYLGAHREPYEIAYHPQRLAPPPPSSLTDLLRCLFGRRRWRSSFLPAAFLNENILDSNALIAGQVRSGKTMRLIAYLSQLMRRRKVYENGRWRDSRPRPILILDLKGDVVLYNSARLEALARGQEFFYFGLEQHDASAYFNFIRTVGHRRAIEFSELVMQALNLWWGEGYGRSYFSKASRELLLAVLRDNKPQSWDELYRCAKDSERKTGNRKKGESLELVATLHALTYFPNLGVAPPGSQEIIMRDVIDKCQVVYFALRPRLHAQSVRDVAKLALYTFLTEAAEHPAVEAKLIKPVVLMDEGHRIAAGNLDLIFQQSSSANMNVIVSAQDRTDFELPDANLLSTMLTNTGFKEYLTFTDPRLAQEVMQASGEQIGVRFSRGPNGVSSSDVLHPRITQEDLNAVNNDRSLSVIHVTRGEGLTEGGAPQIIESFPCLSPEEYRRRELMGWPRTTEPDAEGRRPVVNEKAPEQTQKEAELSFEKLEELYRKHTHSFPTGGTYEPRRTE